MDQPAFHSNRDVAIHVEDLADAEAFYAGILGFEVTERGDNHFALETGSFRLWVNRSTEGRLGFIPSFDVADVAAARGSLVRAGCAIVRESSDGTGFYARDPFGFLFDVIRRGGS